MTTGKRHKTMGPTQGIHVPYNWLVDDITARDALSLEAADIGKIAKLSTGELYILYSLGPPVVWHQIHTGIAGMFGAPVNVTKAAASAGVATTISRSDHKHDINTAAAVSVGTANAEGTSTSLARADHTHEVSALKLSGEAQGDLLYRNATAWVVLPAGTSGQLLKTQGAGANPTWSNHTWANALAQGRTSGTGNNPQISNTAALEHIDGSAVVRASADLDSGNWRTRYFTAAAALIATLTVNTTTGVLTHDQSAVFGNTATSADYSVSILTGGAVNTSRLYFGDLANAQAGQIAYSHNLTRFDHYVEGTIRAILTTAAWLPSGTMDLGSSGSRWDDVFGSKLDASTYLFVANDNLTNVDTSYDDIVIGGGSTVDRGITFKMDGASIRKAGIAVSEGAATLQGAWSYDLDNNRWVARVQATDELWLSNAALQPAANGGLALGVATTGEWSDLRAQAATFTGQLNIDYLAANISVNGGAGQATAVFECAAGFSAFVRFRENAVTLWDIGKTHGDDNFWIDNVATGLSVSVDVATDLVTLPKNLTLSDNAATVTVGGGGGQPIVDLRAASGSDAIIQLRTNTDRDWQLVRQSTSKDFEIERFVAGVLQDTSLSIANATGDVALASRLLVTGATTTNVSTDADDLIAGDGTAASRGLTFKAGATGLYGIAVGEGATTLQGAVRYDTSANEWTFRVENADKARLGTLEFTPSTDLAINLGSGGLRFDAIFNRDITVSRMLRVAGDNGSGAASTTTFTNVVDTAGDTAAAAIGNWRVNGSAGTFHGWVKIWAGTTYVSVPAWQA